MRGCSSPEVGSFKTYVEKVIMNKVSIPVSFEVCQNFPVFRKTYKENLFANLEIMVLMHLVIMTCHSIISPKHVTNFQTIISEILSDLVDDLGFYKMS